MTHRGLSPNRLADIQATKFSSRDSTIAAVVVAGTLTGGGVIATGVASVLMTQLGEMVLSMSATVTTQQFVRAAAIVLATSLRNSQLGVGSIGLWGRV